MKHNTAFRPVHSAAVFFTQPEEGTLSGIYWALVRRARRRGMDDDGCDRAADEIMETVFHCRHTGPGAAQPVSAAVSRGLKHLGSLPIEDRCDRLLQAIFGLEMSTSDHLLPCLDDPAACQQIYLQRLKPDRPAATPQREQELYRQFSDLLSRMGPSAAALRQVTRRRFWTGSTVAKAAALGYRNYLCRCAAAMDLYLNNRQFTPAQAAVAACRTVKADLLEGSTVLCHRLEQVLQVLLGAAVGVGLTTLVCSLKDSRGFTPKDNLVCFFLVLAATGCLDLPRLAMAAACRLAGAAAWLWDVLSPRAPRLPGDIEAIDAHLSALQAQLDAEEARETGGMPTGPIPFPTLPE